MDADTHEIRVTRVVSVLAAGKILSAKTALNQFIGGIVWGIGFALLEHTVRDSRSGRVVTRELADYHVPVNADAPDIDAVFHATGQRVRSLPITLDKLV